MKIRPVGSESFHADGQMQGRTDMTKLRVAFCGFAKAQRNQVYGLYFFFLFKLHIFLTVNLSTQASTVEPRYNDIGL